MIVFNEYTFYLTIKKHVGDLAVASTTLCRMI